MKQCVEMGGQAEQQLMASGLSKLLLQLYLNPGSTLGRAAQIAGIPQDLALRFMRVLAARELDGIDVLIDGKHGSGYLMDFVGGGVSAEVALHHTRYELALSNRGHWVPMADIPPAEQVWMLLALSLLTEETIEDAFEMPVVRGFSQVDNLEESEESMGEETQTDQADCKLSDIRARFLFSSTDHVVRKAVTRLNHAGQFSQAPDGLLFEGRFRFNEEGLRWVRSLGSGLCVLEPGWVRSQLREEAERTMASYDMLFGKK